MEATTVTMVTMVSLEETTTMMMVRLKPRMLMTVTLEARTVTMVTLDAGAMTKTSDGSSVRGSKLSRTHQPPTRTEHGRWATSDGPPFMDYDGIQML